MVLQALGDPGYVAAATASAVVLVVVWRSLQHADRRYPPRPKPRFLVGNLNDIPSGGNEWDAYKALGKKIGSDHVFLNSLGINLLVLNSFEAARDLLDKKGAIYSSRPRLVMINELWEWDWNLIMMPYGKSFTAYRRLMQQEFQPSTVQESYRHVMVRETVSCLDRLLKTPQNLSKHLKQMAGATIMMVTYGHQVTSGDDEFVEIAEAVREHAEKTPGSGLVDVFPPLKYVPSWFPGAGFKRDAALMVKLSWDMRFAPFNAVKKLLAAGTAPPSLVSRLMQTESPLEGVSPDEFAMNAAGVAYSAGADTTVSALLNFYLAMTWYPVVQARAQEELDKVVGRDRLPTFDDRAQLPYISNIVKETIRWQAVSALGVPHSTIEEDEYRGAYIPKNTTVVANLHTMLHDETVYKDPNEFNPDRYNPTPANPAGEPDPSRSAFGFGRRICPGRFFADDALFFAISNMLHVLKISNPEKERVHVTWGSGLVSVPSPFPFKIVPRFPTARDVVAAAE